LGALYLQKQFSASFLWQQKIRLIFFFIGAAGVILFILPSQINIWLVLIASIFTGLYSLPLLPVNLPKYIRNAGFIKTLLLAFTWTFVTAYLPMHQAGIDITATLSLLLLFQRFVFMLILCLIFDCRDAATDKIIGLHSLATDLKPSFVNWINYTLFGLLSIVSFFLYKNGLSLLEAISLFVITLICFFVYLLSLQKRGNVFYYFWVDGLMVLSAILTGLASIVLKISD
jgi:4-hydroxybenzoate polyprenyltransferase